MHDVYVRDQQPGSGVDLVAGFYGWLAVIGSAALLIALLAATGTAVALTQLNINDQVRNIADTVGWLGVTGVLLTLAVSNYAGGYAASRMSWHDGAKQGLVVWAFGVTALLLLGVAGAIFNTQYNLLAALNLPSIPVHGNSFTAAGLLTMLLGLVISALAAMSGGKVGEHYHQHKAEATHPEDWSDVQQFGNRRLAHR
jgi:hypothetical protein